MPISTSHATVSRSHAAQAPGVVVMGSAWFTISVEPAAAIPFYDQACTWGYAEACANLAGHYASGTGIKADPTKTLSFSKKACAWGSASGCKRLGALYLGGIGVAKDVSCASVSFRKACAGGDPGACDLAHREAAELPADTKTTK